jgi:hypothetical protein
MTLWLKEKILEAHLQAQHKRLGFNKAAEAMQNALEEKPPTTQAHMAAFVQHQVNEGTSSTKALKAENPSPTKKHQSRQFYLLMFKLCKIPLKTRPAIISCY